MSRLARSNIKSIYQKIKEKQIEASPLPILTHGGKLSHSLHQKCERLSNPRLARIKTAQETLKLSAALVGSYSLSMNQIGNPIAIFTMHKNMPYGHWLSEESMKQNTVASEVLDYSGEREAKYMLDPKDFECYINPRVTGETVT